MERGYNDFVLEILICAHCLLTKFNIRGVVVIFINGYTENTDIAFISKGAIIKKKLTQ